MSLINRMLRDLSSRQPGSGNVMSGIQVPPDAPRASSPLARLGMLVVLVVAFTGALYLMFGPPLAKPKAPTPRGMSAGASPASVPEADPAAAAPRLQLETQLATAPATAPTAPAPAPATPAPTSAATSAPEPAAPPKPVTARAPRPAAAAPAPAAPKAAPKISAEEHYAQARRALDRGDDAAAEDALTAALAAKSDLHYAREDLANLLLRGGRYAEAEMVLRGGIELDPAFAGYRRAGARLDLARDRPAAAVELLLRDPPPIERDVEYHALLASAYQRLGRHEEASRGYRELARVQPDEANWWAGYALSRDALDDAAGALAAYGRARDLGGLDPRVLEHINQRTVALQPKG